MYGDQIKGPFSFVRIDDVYLEYLAKTKYNLPEHMSKEEKKYFDEEIRTNKEIDSDIKEDRKLLSRKNKEAAEYNKYFEKVIIEREKEVLKQQAIEDAQEAEESSYEDDDIDYDEYDDYYDDQK